MAACWCIALLALAGVARAADFPALAALQVRGARVSAIAVDLGSGDTVRRLHARERLTPASVAKLYTAAAALEQWGPGHRFTTRLLHTGTLQDGVLHGDLIFRGAGDPSLDDRDLWALVAQLRSRGVRRVTGHLVIDESLFGAVTCSTVDRCQARTASRHAYDAPLSAAGVDFASWCVEVRPGLRVGAPATVGCCGVSGSPVAVRDRVITAAAGGRPALAVTRQTRDGRDSLIVSGRIPLDVEPVQVYRAASDAAAQTGAILATILADAGIHTAGIRVVSDAAQTAGALPLAAAAGQSLREQLARMLAYSNNYMADMLALDLVAYDGSSPVTLAAAGERLQALATAAAAAGAIDVGSGSPALHSGSGLTVTDRLSAADVAALLTRLYHRTDLFPAFLGALSVPRYSPLRMLADHGSPLWQTRVSVKTGSLNDPRSVMALAGYYRTRHDGWGAFAIIVNGSKRWPHIPYQDVLAAMRADLGALLQP